MALIAGYRAGSTMKALAAEFGVDRGTVSAHLRHAEVPLRRRGLPREQAGEAARLYEAGWSAKRLATRFGVSADTVLKVLRSADVKIRPRQGGRPAGSHPPKRVAVRFGASPDTVFKALRSAEVTEGGPAGEVRMRPGQGGPPRRRPSERW